MRLAHIPRRESFRIKDQLHLLDRPNSGSLKNFHFKEQVFNGDVKHSRELTFDDWVENTFTVKNWKSLVCLIWR